MAFLAINATVSSYHRSVSMTCLGLVVAALISVGLLTGYNSAYIRDIIGHANANPGYLIGFFNILMPIRGNETILAACILAYPILVLVGRRKLLDVAYLAGAVAVSLVLTTQSGAPGRGLPALVAVFVCFAELAHRKEAEIGQARAEHRTAGAGFLFVTCLMLVFVSEPLLVNSFALFESWRKATSTAPMPGLPPRRLGF